MIDSLSGIRGKADGKIFLLFPWATIQDEPQSGKSLMFCENIKVTIKKMNV
jgi:hypothetical protein